MEITAKNLRKIYGPRTVLEGATFQVSFPHALVLIGPSGGGKSTLLRILAGLIAPDGGELAVNGQAVDFEESALRTYRRRIGVVFQMANLFPHLTAYENVLMPLAKVHGFPDAAERARAMMERFRVAGQADKHPAQLSGGERQRVAIARALAVEPEFVLMDEPTSALDPEMTAEVLDAIADLREAGTPIVLATHEMGFARRVADNVAFVTEGGVAVSSAAEFFENTANPAAAKFLARILKY